MNIKKFKLLTFIPLILVSKYTYAWNAGISPSTDPDVAQNSDAVGSLETIIFIVHCAATFVALYLLIYAGNNYREETNLSKFLLIVAGAFIVGISPSLAKLFFL